MYEVKITAEFTTGITQEDQKKAEQQSTAILLKLLKDGGIAETEGSGIFQVRIVNVESEDLFPPEKRQMAKLVKQVQLTAARREGIITEGLPVNGPGGHTYKVSAPGDGERGSNEAWKTAREFICVCESGQTVLTREYILSHLPDDEDQQ